MKNKLLILLSIFIFVAVSSFTPKSSLCITYMDDNSISLDIIDLPELDEEEYPKVKKVTFRYPFPNEETLNILQELSNLEEIYFEGIDIDDITFLNSITSTHDIVLYFIQTTINFKNIDNDYITGLNIGNSVVKNFKDIENLTSLKSLGFSEMIGYQKLDYTKFPNLTNLVLTSYVDDFSELIDSIPNVTSLSLSGTNIQNKDTKYLRKLTNLTSLSLNQTFITDIDFLEDLPNLEGLTLPWAVTDLSPIYNLHNLHLLSWDAYTELFVTEDLVNYLDSHNISHYDYDPNIKNTIDNIILGLDIDKNTDPKVALEKISRYIVENTYINYYNSTGSDLRTGNPSSLNLLINQHLGVCNHHTIALYTIAKEAGIDDIYGVSGILMKYTDIYTGNEFNNEIDYNFYEPHGWNIVNIDGVWYGIDAAQMNSGGYVVDEDHFYANFLKSPYKDDEYDYSYAISNYYDFNYFFYARHAESDGILTQVQTFEFKNIDGLDIRNHVIYNYNINDSNATNLCNKVLDNYDCTYYDTDNNGNISNGDKVVITKNNVEIDTFILNTSSYVAPIKTHLGRASLEYANYPDEVVNYYVNNYYFNEENPLKVKLKGENYDINQIYETKIVFTDTETNEIVYTNTLNITGAEINNGFYYLVDGSKVTPKQEKECSIDGCSPDYIITIYLNDEVREFSIEYKNVYKETYYISIDTDDNIEIDSNKAISIEKNGDNNFELSAKLGYKIISIKVNNVENINNYQNNKLIIENTTDDIEIMVVTIPEQYAFIEGNNSIYLNKDLVFKINGPLELFKNLYINNKIVAPSNYILASGSTIITLSNEYLNSLHSGEYIIVAHYNNGTLAKATFTINNYGSEESKNDITNPKTGNYYAIPLLMMLMALFVGFFVILTKNKKIFSIIVIISLILITGCDNKKNIVDNQPNKNFINDNNSSKVNSRMKVIINGKEYEANLENNETVKKFINMLPIELSMEELNGNEKYAYLDITLPTNSSNPKKINAGDIMLYGNNCLVVFYKSFDTTYSYTKIGHIDNLPNLDKDKVIIKFESV